LKNTKCERDFEKAGLKYHRRREKGVAKGKLGLKSKLFIVDEVNIQDYEAIVFVGVWAQRFLNMNKF
jgi:hypothetical protein